MSFLTEKWNIRVEVEPRGAGDFGFIRMSLIPADSDAEMIAKCESIADQIRRHVDGLPTYGGRGVMVKWDEKRVCEHCGYPWTEDSPTYNGGCCKQDEDAENERVAKAEGV